MVWGVGVVRVVVCGCDPSSFLRSLVFSPERGRFLLTDGTIRHSSTSCLNLFQVFFFTGDMCSPDSATILLLLTCSIILVAPSCSGQGKLT